MKPGHQRLHLIVETIEVLGESAKFRGVYVCFAHGDTIYHMTRLNLILALLCGLLCGLAEPPAQDGWRTLFDGKNLDNFVPIGSAAWKVEDGIIQVSEHGTCREVVYIPSVILCLRSHQLL